MSEVLFPCECCSQLFETQKQLTDHRDRTCLPKERFECRNCDFVSNRRDNSRKHLSCKHRDLFANIRSINEELKIRTRSLAHEFHEFCGYCQENVPWAPEDTQPFVNRAASDDHILRHLEYHVRTFGQVPVWTERCSQPHGSQPKKSKPSPAISPNVDSASWKEVMARPQATSHTVGLTDFSSYEDTGSSEMRLPDFERPSYSTGYGASTASASFQSIWGFSYE